MARSDVNNLLVECLAAGLGGAIADGLFNPLTVLQARAQLHPNIRVGQIARAATSKSGFVRGLWVPGCLAICLRGLTYSGFRVGCYPLVRETLPGDGFLTKLSAGCMTGAMGATIFAPFELVRIRMLSSAPYRHTLQAFFAISQEEGLHRMWQGCGVWAARCAIYSGVQLATYESTKKILLREQVFRDEGAATHVVASFISGLCGAFASQPVDTVKSMIMNARGGRFGFVATISEELTARGIPGLYRGLLPHLACKGPMVIVFMPLVEQIRHHGFGLDFI